MGPKAIPVVGDVSGAELRSPPGFVDNAQMVVGVREL